MNKPDDKSDNTPDNTPDNRPDNRSGNKYALTYDAARPPENQPENQPVNQKVRSQTGFTLIEVLSALLIFSFAILGMTAASAQSTRAAAALEDKSYASIVADNQLVLARHDSLRLGVQSGDVQIGTHDFTYRVETQSTDIDGFYKLIVRVSLEQTEQVLIERVAFRTRAGAGS